MIKGINPVLSAVPFLQLALQQRRHSLGRQILASHLQVRGRISLCLGGVERVIGRIALECLGLFCLQRCHTLFAQLLSCLNQIGFEKTHCLSRILMNLRLFAIEGHSVFENKHDISSHVSQRVIAAACSLIQAVTNGAEVQGLADDVAIIGTAVLDGPHRLQEGFSCWQVHSTIHEVPCHLHKKTCGKRHLEPRLAVVKRHHIHSAHQKLPLKVVVQKLQLVQLAWHCLAARHAHDVARVV
mmetsp:Transcript_59507/g.96281  ORF Transcript_59507/g.96281 Transcript_59507/m.96281 type:complete len:241 (+) Transcript_59507:438-1160(+)